MPIRPEHLPLYPFDWPQLSASVRFRRARGRCEHCGVRHGAVVSPTYTVRLACCHLDHDPTNNAARNLAALCQVCHLNHDREEHRRRRWRNWFMSAALGDLLEGPYASWGQPGSAPVD